MSQLRWISEEEMAATLKDGATGLFVIDVRSPPEYSDIHVVGAQSLSLPRMLVRRLLKGSISLDAVITDKEMLFGLLRATTIVVYDSNSTGSSARDEFIKLSKTLFARVSSSGASISLLNGGMSAFCRTYPELCCSSKGSRSTPSSISLDTTNAIRKSKEAARKIGTPSEILPHLYLGSARDASDIRVFQELSITAVLNITSGCPNYFESQLQYMYIEVEDSPRADLLSQFQQAISYIETVKTHGGKVLVHCMAGISRSATVCMAYLMQSQKRSLEDAYEFVARKRPIISPNLNFMGQLIQYEKLLST